MQSTESELSNVLVPLDEVELNFQGSGLIGGAFGAIAGLGFGTVVAGFWGGAFLFYAFGTYCDRVFPF